MANEKVYETAYDIINGIEDKIGAGSSLDTIADDMGVKTYRVKGLKENGEAAALPNALGGAWPHTPFSGRSPHPLKAASVSAETLLPASGGAASKVDQSPFEEPPALRGDERNHFRKVIDYEKRYQIQHAHGVR